MLDPLLTHRINAGSINPIVVLGNNWIIFYSFLIVSINLL